MLALLPILLQILEMVPQAVQVGHDLSDVIHRAISLANAPTPASDADIAALTAAVAAEQATLDAKTKELDTDPASPATAASSSKATF